jgi:hypothetical protein
MTNLSKYLSSGYTSRTSKYLSKILPARLVFSIFVDANSILQKNTLKNVELVELPALNSNNILAKELELLCSNYNFENKIALTVSGSIASDEITNYSDFDGVLIYDEIEFTDYNSASKLKKLIEQINLTAHLQDCFQHHGVLVISKSELLDNSDAIIYHLIKESKLIYGDSKFQINNRNKSNYSNSFNKLKVSIQNKLDQEDKWHNQYFFKNMLSELLLLPCSYLQSKNQNYISKKDSFDLIKNQLPSNETSLIRKLENIRTNWHQKKIQKSELKKTTIKKIKSKSQTPLEAITTLSEIKGELLLFIISLRPND